MFVHDINPFLLNIGPFNIRYYGLIFALGILFSFLIFKYLAKKRKLPLKNKDYDELLVVGIIATIVGARLGSVLSSINIYIADPIQVFAVWQGGMAFHGGFVGLVLAGLWFAKRKNISFYDFADILVIPAALALAFGRIANFINGEFYGTPTNLPWAVKFKYVEEFRHPVQLYESLKNFIAFGVLWYLRNKNLPKGTLFWLFVTYYGLIRFVLEFIKDVPGIAFGLTWGQVWNIPMVVVGSYMLYKLLGKKSKSQPTKDLSNNPTT
jgi:phosphatidylglycerol---prolipoprotein diacylglyceryl transferase